MIVDNLAEWHSPEGLAIILREFMTYYDAHKADKTAAYAGMPEAVARMKEAGVSLAVLSNKADQMAGPVVEHYYPGLFPLVQGALDGVPTKPDPHAAAQADGAHGRHQGGYLVRGGQQCGY